VYTKKNENMKKNYNFRKTVAYVSSHVRSLFLLLIMGLLYSPSSFSQINNSESFDGATFVPTGWTNFLTSGTNIWSRVTAGTFPTIPTHSGAAMAKFDSYTTNGGVRSIITPVIDLSGRGVTATNVSFWMYRDNGYSTTADKIEVLYNTVADVAGATLLGTVNRSRSLAPTQVANGWYQYTFAIPAGFTGSSNYLIIRGTSAYGNNIFVDDVAWQSFPPACSGTPAPGNTLSTLNPVCPGASITLSLQNATTGGGVTYQWQSSPDGITYSNVASTSATFNTTQTVSTYYQCIVTCSGSASSGTSTPILVNMVPTTYATIPYLETFEASWINGCATKDIVSTSWKNNPVTGNNSWRRQDEGATAAWSYLPGGLVTPSGSTGAASFHTYGAADGLIGTYDLYLDLSTTSAVSLGFNYQNATGFDIMEVLLSTDGGVTFGPVLGTYTTGSWASQTINLGVVASATSVIRFKATSDFGDDDIGIDNVVVALTPNCPPPNALTASAITTTSANLGWTCTSCVGSFALEYGPTGFAPGTGTIVNPAVSPLAVSGLTAGTTYQYYVIQDCSGTGAGFSPASGPVSFTTKMLGDDVCSSIGLTFGSNGPYDNTTATNEIGEPIPLAGGCNTQINWCDFSSAAENSMWFSFVAPASGRVNIQAPGFDTQLALWSAPNCASILTGGATLLAANDDAAGAPSYSSILTEVNCLTPGTTYYLQLDGYSGAVGSTVIILTDLGVVNASFTGLSSSYCLGVSSAALTPATSGGVFSGTGISGSSFNPSVAGVGSYTVSYTVNGCYTSTQSVTVNALPTVTATSTGSSVCSGTSVTLTGGGATSYAWDNSVVDATAFVPTGSLSYNVVGTDVNGCTNTASVSVTVNALPTVTATSTGSSVCSGTSVTLTGGGATSYAWDNSVVDGTAFVPSGTLSYNVVGTDVNGCTNTASVSVTVNALPTVTATSTGSSVCSGTSVTLTGGGATTYVWDNSVIDGSSFIPSGSLSYNVVGTDVNGCTNTASVSVTVNALPMIMASSTPVLCNGGTSSVTITGMDGTPSYTGEGTFTQSAGTATYSITDANGCVASTNVTISEPAIISSTQILTVCAGEVVIVGSNTYNTTGIFTDVLISAFGCDSSVTTDLTVNAPLDLTTSVSGNVITATSATATYQWIDCDNGNVIIPGETGQTYTALSGGNFAVIITEAGSCSDTSACVNVSVTGIDSNFEQIVSIYPNPSNGLFTLSINNVVTNQIVISILDIQGKIVFAETDKNISADYKKQINLSDLAKGIYYVKINIGSDLKTQKLIVQ
jgi:hypothetical protein